MKVYASTHLLHDGAELAPGEELEVSDELGKQLLDRDVAAKSKREALKAAAVEADTESVDDDE